MLQTDGQNSIIIVGGANMSYWPQQFSYQDLDVVKKAGIVLLQREIPDYVNIQAPSGMLQRSNCWNFGIKTSKAAKSAGVTVVMDAGGMDAPMPQELLNFVDIFSPNESELCRLTGMPTENFEQISKAAGKCHKMVPRFYYKINVNTFQGVKQVLVKLGAKGFALFVEGAGDTFAASFAVALLEGKSKKEWLRFAELAHMRCIEKLFSKFGWNEHYGGRQSDHLASLERLLKDTTFPELLEFKNCLQSGKDAVSSGNVAKGFDHNIHIYLEGIKRLNEHNQHLFEHNEPEIDEAEPNEPEISEPEINEPEPVEPENNKPEPSEPDINEPEIDEPEPAQVRIDAEYEAPQISSDESDFSDESDGDGSHRKPRHPEFNTATDIINPKLKQDVRNYYGVMVSTSKCSRAKCIALEKLHGNHTEQYAKLYDYLSELRYTNPGTTTVCHLDERVFKRGHLLVVVGVDADDSIYPLAFAVVESENQSSWFWFLELLGLVEAVEELFPNAEHKTCVRHLYSNFKSNGHHKGKTLKDQLWMAARATYVREFEYAMKGMKFKRSNEVVMQNQTSSSRSQQPAGVHTVRCMPTPTVPLSQDSCVTQSSPHQQAPTPNQAAMQNQRTSPRAQSPSQGYTVRWMPTPTVHIRQQTFLSQSSPKRHKSDTSGSQPSPQN
ncbi:Detected protein of confused Function [Hibiscus syriacus]|uniref:Detected protein of confused Function n=1 Tax=Hibiscus syriacus TaxID=106335 RepID=A0A6A2X1J7_HIBSY|nr:Detected protein of confused Function [Hibiscus syriacus]